MSRKVTATNGVNNLASVNFRHSGKSKHFALDLGISLATAEAPLGIFLGFQSKMFRFSTMRSNN